MEESAKKGKIGFWQCLFYFDLCDISYLKTKFGREMEVTKSVFLKMDYFHNLVKEGNRLTTNSVKFLDITKVLGNDLDNILADMKVDFTDEEIEEQLGDDFGFADDYALQFEELCADLDAKCALVIEDCVSRKEKLLHAIVWG